MTKIIFLTIVYLFSQRIKASPKRLQYAWACEDQKNNTPKNDAPKQRPFQIIDINDSGMRKGIMSILSILRNENYAVFLDIILVVLSNEKIQLDDETFNFLKRKHFTDLIIHLSKQRCIYFINRDKTI